MNKIVKYILISVIVALVLLKGCGMIKDGFKLSLPKPCYSITDTTYVDVVKTSEIYTPVIKKEFFTLTDTVYLNNEITIVEERELTYADTLTIMSDYYTKRNYSDTISVEYGNIVINDQLWKNKVYSRSYELDLKFPEYATSKTSKFKLFGGAMYSLQFSSESSVNMIDILPSLFVGAGYSFKDGHTAYYERDFARNDNRIIYEYDKNRLEVGSTYSTRYKYLVLSAKLNLFK